MCRKRVKKVLEFQQQSSPVGSREEMSLERRGGPQLYLEEHTAHLFNPTLKQPVSVGFLACHEMVCN